MNPKPPTTTLDQWKMWVKNGFDGAHLVPLPAGQKGPKEVGWQDRAWSRDQLKQFAQSGYDLGLRTRYYPTLDIDADDPEVVDEVLAELAAMGLFNKAIIRKREGFSRCAVIWAGEPAPKIKRRFLLDGQPFALELLGDGQQVKVAGTHPDDGSMFWAEDVRPRDELTKLAVGREDLLDALEAELRDAFEGRDFERLGGAGARSTRGTRGSGQANVEQGSPERVKELLDRLPNSVETFGDYDTVIARVLAPVYGASGGADWGHELWREWAQSGDFEGENDDDWVDEKWRSFHGAGSSLGMDALRGTVLEFGDAEARAAASRDALGRGSDIGDQLAAQGYSDEPDEVRAAQVATAKTLERSGVREYSLSEIESDPVGSAAGWADDLPAVASVGSLDQAIRLLVWNVADNTVYERATGAPLLRGKGLSGAAQVLERDFGNDRVLTKIVPAKGSGSGSGGGTTTKKVSIREYLEQSPDLIRVAGFVYHPGAPEFVRYTGRGSGVHGQLRKNLWVAPAEVRAAVRELAEHGNISGMDGKSLETSLFGRLAREIFRHSGEPNWDELLEAFLDWVALVVCAPAIKPSFHWLVSSEVQGTGKSLLGQCLADLVGSGNWMTVDQSLLMGQFQDYQSNKLIWLDEVAGVVKDAAGRLNRSAYDRIKSGMTGAPAEVWINPKMEKPYPVRNTGAWLMLSNHGAETLGLERDDRRLAVIESLVERSHTRGLCVDLVRVRSGSRGGVWTRNMTRACAARLREVRADASRWGRVVSADAPDTSSKAEVIESSLSPVADAIKRAWDDGLFGSVVRLRDVQDAVQGRRTVPSSVAGAIASPQVASSALRELGAVKIRNARRAVPGDKNQHKVWVLPSESMGAPSREGVSRKEWEAQMRSWANAAQDFTEEKLRENYLGGD